MDTKIEQFFNDKYFNLNISLLIILETLNKNVAYKLKMMLF